MNIRIKATQIELTEEIKNHIQTKMDMLEKFLGDMPVITCDFEVGLTSGHHQKGEIYRAEANLNLGHEVLHIEKTETELFKAIEKVKDHLAEMIKRYKEKLRD